MTNKFMKTAIDIRLKEIMNHISTKKRRYIKARNKIRKIQEEIIEKLPEANKNLLFRYEEEESFKDSIIQEFIYKKGLIDGIKISNMCRKISNLC